MNSRTIHSIRTPAVLVLAICTGVLGPLLVGAQTNPPVWQGCLPFGDVATTDAPKIKQPIPHLVLISQQFFENPQKWPRKLQLKSNEQEVNAFSYPSRKNTSGYIVLGTPLLEKAYDMGAGMHSEPTKAEICGSEMVTFIIAHEFGHQVQYEILEPIFHCYLDKKGNPKPSTDVELEADAIAAAWMRSQYGIETDDEVFSVLGNLFRTIGTYDFTSPQYHGTDDDRDWAISTGLEAIGKRAPLSTNTLKSIHATIFKGRPNQWAYNAKTQKAVLVRTSEIMNALAMMQADIGPIKKSELKLVDTSFSKLIDKNGSLFRFTRLGGPNGQNQEQVAQTIYATLKAKNAWKELTEVKTGFNGSDDPNKLLRHQISDVSEQLESARRSATLVKAWEGSDRLN